MTRRRRFLLIGTVAALFAALVILLVTTRIERRRTTLREIPGEGGVAGAIPPVDEWTAAFRSLDAQSLLALLDRIAAEHADLYDRWSLRYLHARAAMDAGDESQARDLLAPFTERENPFRIPAMHHLAAIAEPQQASRVRQELIFEIEDSTYREEAIEDEVEYLASLPAVEPLEEFAARTASSASSGLRRELASRILEKKLATSPDDSTIRRAILLLEGGVSDDAANRVALSLDQHAGGRLDEPALALVGEALQTHRHFDRAVEVLGEALRRRDDDELRFLLGRSHFGAERFAEAQTVYERGAARAQSAERKALFFWHAARSAQIRGDDSAAERLMTAAIAVKGTFPATTAAITQRIRTRVRQNRMREATSDFVLLRRIAGARRATFEGALALAVGRLARGDERGALEVLSSVPRAATTETDRVELTYWKARAQERPEPEAAVRGYLAVITAADGEPYARFAQQRLALPGLASAVARAASVREQGAEHEMRKGALDLARRIQTDRLHLTAPDRPRQLQRLREIYERIPGYRAVLELEPEDLPRFPLRNPEPLELLLAMGLDDDAMQRARGRWGLRPERAALTRSLVLQRGGASRDSIHAIEVLMRSVPDGFVFDLLPATVRSLLYPRYFRAAIESGAERHGADPALVLAIMREESRFNPRAKSAAAARGLLQFIITTARDVGRSIGLVDLTAEDLYDPRIVIELGSKYVGELLERFEGNRYRAVAAYNAGPRQTELWSRLQPGPGDDYFLAAVNFDETKGYVRKVMRSYGRYAD